MKLRTALPVLALSAIAGMAGAQTVQNDGYARDLSSEVVKNPFGLCWRSGQWTDAKAIDGCDAVPKAAAPARPAAPPVAVPQIAEPKVMAAPAPAPAPMVAAPVVAAPTPVAIRRQAITLSADTSFDTGKADLKPEGQAKLDELAAKLRDVSFESIAVTGHTDNVGGDALNQRLSLRRANAVKDYLATRGVDPAKIRTNGRGKANPIADNKTAQGRARNRRVDVEISGTRTM